MRTQTTLLAALLLAGVLAPQIAQAQLDAGVVLWRHYAELDVVRAVDFDGSDETGEERGRNWDAQSSGFGAEATYRFPRILRVSAQIALAQSIVAFEDISDPLRDVRTLAMDNAVRFTIGARPEGSFPNNPNLFWSGGVSFSIMDSKLNEDLLSTWNYDETLLAVDGRIGYRMAHLAFFGGLRFSNYDAELKETDLGNLPGQQIRKIEYERDGTTDVLLGVQTTGSKIAGSVELGFIGATSARVGLAHRF